MSTYDDASLIMFPSGYKAGKAYSLKPTDGSGDLTFTRASTATRVNEQGLIEGVRTNLLLQSNTFSNASWLVTNATLTSGQAGYDGTTNAWSLNKTDAAGHTRQVISLNGEQTTSVYAKAGALNWLAFISGGSSTAYFDLQNGVLGTISAGATAQIVSVGGGWYRCSLSQNVSLTQLRIYPADGDLNVGGTSGNIYIQDAQLEQSVQATENIPTTTAAVSVGMLANVPRIDYTGGGCAKLLLEPQRTNLFTYSEDFSVSWSGNQLDFNVNNVISPDGTQNADFIIENTTSNPHFLFQTIGTTTISDYTISVFAKYNGRILQIFAGGGDISGNPYANFDLENGLFNNNGCNDAFIEDYGNGWYRCGIVVTSAVTIGFNPCFGLANTLGSTRAATYVGNGTSGVYLWGAQVE